MQGDDGGDYDYPDESSSAQDKMSSETNQVTDDVMPTTMGKAKTEYSVRAGEKVTLQCPVNNLGGSIILWYKGQDIVTQDRTYIIKDKRYELTSNWSLIIKDVKVSDEGVYTCNVVPNNLNLKAKLIVIRPPTIQIIEEGRDVTDQQLSFRQGEKIRLDCQSGDNPQPKFIWSLNGARLEKQNGVVVDRGTLVIESAQAHHSDVFQCLAENSHQLLTHKTVTIHVDCE